MNFKNNLEGERRKSVLYFIFNFLKTKSCVLKLPSKSHNSFKTVNRKDRCFFMIKLSFHVIVSFALIKIILRDHHNIYITLEKTLNLGFSKLQFKKYLTKSECSFTLISFIVNACCLLPSDKRRQMKHSIITEGIVQRASFNTMP